MKVRVVKKPDYEYLYFIQVKRWWFPFWCDVFYSGEKETMRKYKTFLDTGSLIEVVNEGEIK